MKNITNLFYRKKTEFKEIISVFGLIGILKSLVFFVPLWMLDIVDSNTFGQFEYSLSLGQTLLGFFAMGLGGGYAYFVINQKKEEFISIFHLHFAVIISLISILSLLYFSFLNSPIFTGVIIGLFLANQVFISSIEKLNSRNNLSIIIDSAIYFLLLNYLVILKISTWDFSLFIWNLILLISLLLSLFFYHIPKINTKEIFHKSRFTKIYKFGGLMLLVSPLVALNTVSNRLYIEYFINIDAVAVFSFYFRVATFSLLIYKAISILLYRRIFLNNYEILDKIFWKTSLFFVIFNFLFAFIGITFFSSYLEQINDTAYDYAPIFIMCLFQITFWINNALLEPIFQRANLLIPYIIINAIAFLIMLILFFVLSNSELNILLMTKINVSILVLLGMTQLFFLKRKNIIFNRLITIYVSSAIFFVFYNLSY